MTPTPLAGLRRSAVWASPAVVALAVFGLGLVSVLLAPEGSPVAVWWPAAGVAVAAVATTTGRRRGLMLVAVGGASFLANLAAGRSPTSAAAFAVADTVEGLVAGYWLGRHGRPTLLNLPDLGRLLAAAATGAVVAGGLAAVASTAMGGADLLPVWWAVASSHGAAVLVLVPLVMRLPARTVTVGRWEQASSWTAGPVATVAVFAPAQPLPMTFLPVAVLAWTGFRLGVRTATVQLLVVGSLVSILTAHGGGPFAMVGRLAAPPTAGALVQMFLVACTLVVLALAVSVAQREAAHAALVDQQRFDKAVLEVVNAAVVACDADGEIVVRNAAHRRLTGLTDAENLTSEQHRTPLRHALAGEDVTDLPLRIGPADTALHDVIATARPIRGADGRLLGAVLACTDVTAERVVQARLRDSVAFHDAVLAASPDLIDIVDAHTLAVLWSSRDVAGVPAPLRTAADDAVLHPDDVHLVRGACDAARHLADGEVASLRYRIRSGEGRYRWFSRRITPFAREPGGLVRQLLGVARDITETVEVERRLADAALHDPLTGLPNRRLLTDRLDAALKEVPADGQVVVLFCDLDGFKHVNDAAGHAAGDAVLTATASRLRAVLRPADTVARVGGDEFAILLHPPSGDPSDGTDGHVGVHERARSVARRVTAALAEPVDVDGNAHTVTVSVGVTMAQPGDDPDDVLRDADAAMYQAKARGKDRHAVYDDTLRADVVERRRVQRVLRAALRDPELPPDGLTVAYQAIVDLSTQRLAGVEALARLVDDRGLPVAPDVFIPIAEDTGLIAALGRHVLDTACADLATWHAAHPAWRRLGVSVNLSARQADLTDLVAEVRHALDHTGLAPQLLTVELTETVLIEAGHATIQALREMRELGVEIAIDDFGTGYASLRHLAQLPITGLKIDRSFTAGLPDDPTSVTIVRTIAGLARDLGLTCVAEGIETDAQLLALPSGLLGQGYLLGRPVPAGKIDDQLTAQSSGVLK